VYELISFASGKRGELGFGREAFTVVHFTTRGGLILGGKGGVELEGGGE